METATETGLTKLDISALRSADDVYAVLSDGNYLLRCIKRPSFQERDTDPWADDKRHEVPCEGYQRTYRADSSSDPHGFSIGFASLWHSTGIWQIVQPGDRIRLVFSRNGLLSDNLRAVGYVGDSVSIEVIRKRDTDGRKPLRFLGETYVGPDNLARICRNS